MCTPTFRFSEPYRAGLVTVHGGRGRLSAHADEADGVAGRVYPLRHSVGGVALDGLDLTIGEHRLDEADVLVEDDEIAGLGRLARTGGVRPAVLLGPRVELVDRTEALAVRTQRRAGLVRDPRGEVRAPRRARDGALRGGAVVGDPSRVVRPGRLLRLSDLLLG